VYVIWGSSLDGIVWLDDPASLAWTLLLIAILVLIFIVCTGVQCIYLSQNDRLSHDGVTTKFQKYLLYVLKNRSRLSKLISYGGPIVSLILLGYFMNEIIMLSLSPFIDNIPFILRTLVILGLLIASSCMLGYVYYRLQMVWIPRWLRESKYVLKDELRKLMKQDEHTNQVQQSRVVLVDNVLEFSETMAREIMTPRMDMYCLDINRSFQWNVQFAMTQMRTRYPVINDGKDDVMGFIHIKDLLLKNKAEEKNTNLQQWIRPILAVSETMAIHELLTLMQKQRAQIALLIDEYGGTSGMVTLEDILEELVGDIQDEFDKEVYAIEKTNEQEYSLSAMLLVEEVNSYFNIAIEVDEIDSIGGFMYANIQFPPRIGQCVVYKEGNVQYEFMIKEMEQLRITRLRLKLLEIGKEVMTKT